MISFEHLNETAKWHGKVVMVARRQHAQPECLDIARKDLRHAKPWQSAPRGRSSRRPDPHTCDQPCARAIGRDQSGTRFDLYAPGLEQAGLASSRLFFAEAKDDAEALALAEDGVREGALAAVVGRVQREGEVIHVIIDRLVDEAPLLGRIGGMAMPHKTGRGDGARHAGAPDRGDPGWRPRDSYWPPHADGMDPEAVVRVKSRDFH